jgi:hypothetical protein
MQLLKSTFFASLTRHLHRRYKTAADFYSEAQCSIRGKVLSRLHGSVPVQGTFGITQIKAESYDKVSTSFMIPRKRKRSVKMK